jgi:aspartate kinase
MFAALSEASVNMKMITTGDIKISVLVNKADGFKALRAVHQAFGLDKPRPGAGLPRPANGGSPDTTPVEGIEEITSQELANITQRLSSMEEIVVSDVLLNTSEGRITIFNLPDKAGNCSRVFQSVAAGGIVVDMIVQNLSEPTKAQLSFSVPLKDLQRALKLTEDIVHAIDPGTRVVADPDIAKLFVLGVGMRTHTGVARRMFGALAQRGINISMINTSEMRVSVVVDQDRGEEALAALKEAFQVA